MSKDKPNPRPKPKPRPSDERDPLEHDWHERLRQFSEARALRKTEQVKREETERLRQAEIEDRMARYRRHAPCPQCDGYPSVCTLRRPGYAAFRCRACDHRWEVKAGSKVFDPSVLEVR